MNLATNKALRVGLGIRGFFGTVVLGFICLFEPLFGEAKSLLWAKILLMLAAFVYLIFALIWDKKFISLTALQVLMALALLGLTLQSGSALFIAFGLFAHAIWDLWHLATEKRYVPWWYAGACVYVDLAAVALILINA
jgi:hypothetical protein